MGGIIGWDGRRVGARASRGERAVTYFERWQDNVLPSPTGQWPPWLENQVRSYVARPSWFSRDDAIALAAQLGGISKFQSANSEDALTWSWFGTLSCVSPAKRRATLAWLYEHAAIDALPSFGAAVDQWPRVLHPNSLGSSRGPELDARIDDPSGAVIYVEAKWEADLGSGRGAVAGERDDQIILRRDSLAKDPKYDDDRTHVVLGVGREARDVAEYELSNGRRRVFVRWLTWADLASCRSHPLADEFGRYLAWRSG